MSVLIKGMKMPTDCVSCRWHRKGRCILTDVETNTGRDCPLVEVPTPHGRLIDADETKEALRRAEALTRAFGYHNVIQTVSEVPTIIEAEEGEQDASVGRFI